MWLRMEYIQTNTSFYFKYLSSFRVLIMALLSTRNTRHFIAISYERNSRKVLIESNTRSKVGSRLTGFSSVRKMKLQKLASPICIRSKPQRVKLASCTYCTHLMVVTNCLIQFLEYNFPAFISPENNPTAVSIFPISK